MDIKDLIFYLLQTEEGRYLLNNFIKKKKRKRFTKATKRYTLEFQNYRCAICSRSLGVVDFDHINGDQSNNSYLNCQALCPNCHAEKTRKRKKYF